MKKEKLRMRLVAIGFLIIIIVVGVVFGMTYSYYKNDNTDSSTQVSGTETTLTTSDVTTVETSTETSTETLTSTETSVVTFVSTDVTNETIETTIATPIESAIVSSVTESETLQSAESSSTLGSTTTAVTESALIWTINASTPTPAPVPATSLHSKTVEELVSEVWQGKWGVGETRKKKLEAAGYNYAEVQQAVNKSAKTNYSTTKKSGNSSLQLVKTFTKGTYYAYGGPRKGGSGRQLIDCSYGSNGVRGSIASWYLYKHYGYNYNGKRTKVYLEVSGYPSMNGYYYLDDSCAPGYNNVIDFFFIRNGNCPFRKQGVVTVKCYVVK